MVGVAVGREAAAQVEASFAAGYQVEDRGDGVLEPKSRAVAVPPLDSVTTYPPLLLDGEGWVRRQPEGRTSSSTAIPPEA